MTWHCGCSLLRESFYTYHTEDVDSSVAVETGTTSCVWLHSGTLAGVGPLSDDIMNVPGPQLWHLFCHAACHVFVPGDTSAQPSLAGTLAVMSRELS